MLPYSVDRLKATKEYALTWLPAVLGGMFPLVVKLDHWLYSQSKIGVRIAFGIEAAYLLICILALIAAILLAVRMMQRRTLVRVLWIAISILLCFYFLGVGFESGAALLYAT